MTSWSSSVNPLTSSSKRFRSSEATAAASGDGAASPGRKRSTSRSSSCAQRPVGLDEALLRGILGISGRPGDDVGGPKRNLLISLHDLLIGGRISALGACDELGIFLWSALHRNASSTPGAGLWFPQICNQVRSWWV